MPPVFRVGVGLLACWTACHAQVPEPGSGIQRSDLFEFAAGDRIEDSGRLLVTGGRLDRVEDFEVVRRADGGRSISTIVAAAGDSYRVQARLTFSADEYALTAVGEGSYEGQPAMVNIQRDGNSAELVLAGARYEARNAPCRSDCLIDMSPSALPMFTMTRRYDETAGGAQTFRWVGRSLIVDQILLDGSVEISKLGDFVFRHGDRETAVQQYAFVENLRDEASGRFFRVAFNLYTTADDRPLAFATGGTTVGERLGYEGITQALPPQIPTLR